MILRALSQWGRQRHFAKYNLQEVDISFVDAGAMRQLNRRYRASSHDTDVLAFSCEERGDILISLDQAKRQSRERHVPLVHELLLLSLHGMLHLMGFDDESFVKRREMRRQEFRAVMRILSF